MKRGRRMEKKQAIAAPPETVWRALTEAEEMAKWFAAEVRADHHPGGEVWSSWGPGVEMSEEILVWEPNRHLGKAMPSMVEDAGKPVLTHVDFYLEGEKGETVLRLVHSGFGEGEPWDDEFNALSDGWNIFLETLRHYLERFVGQPARYHSLSRPVTGSLTEVFAKLYGSGSLTFTGNLARIGKYEPLVLSIGGEALSCHMLYSMPGQGLVVSLDDHNDCILGLYLERYGPMLLFNYSRIVYGGAGDLPLALRQKIDQVLASVLVFQNE